MRHCISLAAALTMLAVAPHATAGIVYVDANRTTGLDDGSSWADAFQGSDGLRRALLVATGGDQVFVAQGTYLPTATGAQDDRFLPPEGVELYGGFLGTESSPAERPPFHSAVTILSGDLNGDDPQTSDNTHGLVDVTGLTRATVLDGFMISGARLGAIGPPWGGALTCSGGCSPTVRNCLFQGNRSVTGGAFDVDDGAPLFTDCTFEDNGSTAGWVYYTTPGTLAEFERCVFRNGGLELLGGLAKLTDCLFEDITNARAAVDVSDLDGDEPVLIDRCVFRNNSTAALRLGGADAHVTNSLFVGNTSTLGGVVHVTGLGPVRFRNNTLVGNVAPPRVGAIHLEGFSGPVTVANCILWDNADPSGSQTAEQQISGGLAASWSIVEGGLPGAGNLDLDPQFADPGAGDYSLTLDSPAVDAGSNAAVPLTLTLDLAGNPRFADEARVPDTGLGGQPLVDIGAFELVPTPVPTFCDATDGALAACPCGNPGAPESGCDVAQGTGGVHLKVLAQRTTPSNRATMTATGFHASGFPTSLVVRAPALDPLQPVAFGNGLRCVGTPLVRLDARTASVGIANHTFGHGTAAGSFVYQLWFRDTPVSYCTPEAFNLSNGVSLTW